MAARILMALPPRKPKKWSESDISKSIEAAMGNLFDELYQLGPEIDENDRPEPIVLGMSQPAKEKWIDYYNAHNVEQAKTSGDIAAAFSKLEEYPLRFALIFHLVKQATQITSSRSIDDASIDAGVVLANWFKAEAERVYATLAESADMSDARELVRWIDGKGGRVTSRQVQQGHREFTNAGDANGALESLVMKGFGDWEPSPSGQRGQPTRFFVLNTVYMPTVYGNTLNTEGNDNTVDRRRVDTEKGENTKTPELELMEGEL